METDALREWSNADTWTEPDLPLPQTAWVSLRAPWWTPGDWLDADMSHCSNSNDGDLNTTGQQWQWKKARFTTHRSWLDSISIFYLLVERVSKKRSNTGRPCCQCLHLQWERACESTALFHVLTAVGITKANSVKCHVCSHHIIKISVGRNRFQSN